MTLDFVRLYDSIPLEQAEARMWFPGTTGVTTTLNASETCRIDRDELGWLHVQLGRKVDDKVEWRAKAIILPPSAVRFAESASASMNATMPEPLPMPTLEQMSDLRNTVPPTPEQVAGWGQAFREAEFGPQPKQDPAFRHPKAKKR